MPKQTNGRKNRSVARDDLAKHRGKMVQNLQRLQAQSSLDEKDQMTLKRLEELAEMNDEDFAAVEPEDIMDLGGDDEGDNKDTGNDVSGNDNSDKPSSSQSTVSSSDLKEEEEKPETEDEDLSNSTPRDNDVKMGGNGKSDDNSADNSTSKTGPDSVKKEGDGEEGQPKLSTIPPIGGPLKFPSLSSPDLSEEKQWEGEELWIAPSSGVNGSCETVGYTKKGQYYLNRYGIRGAAIYRLEKFASPPDFEPDAETQIVSDPMIQIGPQRKKAGGYTYAGRHVFAVYGIALQGSEKPSETDPDFINPDFVEKGFPLTYILVGWQLDPQDPNNITRRWETRSTLRRLWGKADADYMIFKAAAEAERRYAKREGRESTADLIPQYTQTQRNKSRSPAKSVQARAQQDTWRNHIVQQSTDNTEYVRHMQPMQSMQQMQQISQMQQMMQQMIEQMAAIMSQLPQNDTPTPVATPGFSAIPSARGVVSH